MPRGVIVADCQGSEICALTMRGCGGVIEQSEHFGFRPSEDLMDAMIRVDLEFPDAALDAITAKWGSIESVFAAGGVDEALLGRFRVVFVD